METRALLNIWGEHDVQTALDGNFRNSHVYRDVANRLCELGFDRTPDQCRIRVKSLKRQYFQAKEGSRKNGQYHKMCKFYDEMERILSNRSLLERQDIDSVAVGGDETMDEDAESTELLQEAHMDGSGECSFMEHPVKTEYPSCPIPVTVGGMSMSTYSDPSESTDLPSVAYSVWFPVCVCVRVNIRVFFSQRFVSNQAEQPDEEQPAGDLVQQATEKQEALRQHVAGEADGEVPGAEHGGGRQLLQARRAASSVRG